MTTTENIQTLQAFADEQAGYALQMYKIMKSTFQIIEEIKLHNCGEGCQLINTGLGYVNDNLAEFRELLMRIDESVMSLQIK